METISDINVETSNGLKESLILQLSRREQRERGKYIRKNCSRISHKEWKVREGRPDPVSLIEKANVIR
jgi:hypothetical protein